MNQKQRAKMRQEYFHKGVEQTTGALFAAVAVAAHRDFGFGANRCARLLNDAYHIMLEQISSKEALDACWDEVGLRIDFSEPFDPVEVTGDAQKGTR